MHMRLTSLFAVIMAFGLIAVAVTSSGAVAPATPAFERTWARTDKPVADGAVARTWMWGPEANSAAVYEDYAEAPNGQRVVQYYDKSRMEITQPGSDESSVWYVTNGLLVVEMITGRLQAGDNTFLDRAPADVPVAGDLDDTAGPTYATFASLLDAPPLADGAAITQRVDRDGTVSDDPSLAGYGVTAAFRVTEPGIDHQVAGPFWSFMNSAGTVYEDGQFFDAGLFLSPYYATGYPVTEAYWAEVKVAGTYRLVLMQCFERRCLTYTPGNPAGFLTEAGNVGLHYYAWRYGATDPPTETATATATATSTHADTETTTATTTVTASATATDTQEATSTATTDPSGTPTQSPTATATSTPTSTPTPTPTSTPTGVPEAVGRVYVTDFLAERVLVFDLAGNYLFTFGESGYDPGQFNYPYGIAVDPEQGWIYIADMHRDRVLKFDLNGNFLLEWGETGSGPGQLNHPTGVAVGPGGHVYVTDWSHRIQRFRPTGEFVLEWGGSGSGDGQFAYPFGIVVNANHRVFVVDQNNGRVQKFNPEGDYLTQWGETGSAELGFNDPRFIAADESGSIYVTDYENDRVTKTDTFGSFVRLWHGNSAANGGLDNPSGIALDPELSESGYHVVYVVDSANDRVSVFDGDSGTWLFDFGESGTGDGQFEYPAGIAVYRLATR